MKNIILLLTLIGFSFSVHAKENCSLGSIGLSENDDVAQKLFFTGTCHYRNNDYEKAARSWEELGNIEKINPDYEDLQVDALNNLGYLKFFGYGISVDKEQAIVFWKKAISLGQYESEYHLCHAYADKAEPTFDRLKAQKHCEKAYLIYKGMENRSERDEEVFELVKEYRARVR